MDEWVELHPPDPEGLEEVAKVKNGSYAIYRAPNKLIGGYDYYSDSLGAIFKIVDSSTRVEELQAVVDAILIQEIEDLSNKLEKAMGR